ncbi:ferredoxin--NADP reductase [Paraferrimonas sedimenticola]|uniref:ferredoxin--NADP(+) reductase n=1 Tax=Paraferrimonas sedimenticola TaxID=375674 RepID=A0AA37RVD8_9GAMM|nr:ferredoxin--NADP reductase [Paraferrimonas sedimenticola]GLP95537.1 ferredoxin--NADP(+) reductase [Paraferrimonas sedimenticola]
MWVEGKVMQRIDWNNKLFSLRIDADIAPYTAGQFIKLSQIKDEKRVARAYSLVNGEGSDFLEVLAVEVEEGQLSPNLHQLEPGDSIQVSAKAAGFLVVDEVPAAKNLWLLATGTAVGPFVSMLQGQAIWDKFERIYLAYGARFEEDLAYRDQLDEFVQRAPKRFAWQPLITREDFEGNLRMRIPQALEQGVLQSQWDCPIVADDCQFMLCGNPDMIQETVEWLKSQGLQKNLRRKPGQITVEKYW